MSSEERTKTSRRSFLRTVGLGALGALAWTTLFRRGTLGGPNKTPRSRCGQCRVLSACSRPDALQVRDALDIQPDVKRALSIDDAERLCLGNVTKNPSSDTGS